MTGDPRQMLDQLVALRRALHQIPELGYEEKLTAARLVDELEARGIRYVYHGPGGGIVARVDGVDRDGPTIALRAEMDALPVLEQTGLPFSSRHAGRMHACGHDGHMTMVIGALDLFRAEPPPGDVVAIFQPAEEGGAGAKLMVERGAMDGVSMVFGGHMTRHYTLGQIMIPSGLVAAQSDRFEFRIQGRGGHGARPHEGSDTVIPSAALVMALQALITRESNAFHPTVLSIGRLEAGSAHNVIADRAMLEGIIRTTAPDGVPRLTERMREIAKHTGEAFAAQISVTFDKHYPAVVNAAEAVPIARRAAVATVGEAGVMTHEMPSMGAEDFSFYLASAPGCYVRFGARRADQPDIPLHSPQFDFEEALLPVGARYFECVVREAIVELRGE